MSANDRAFPATTSGDCLGLTKREYAAIQIAAGMWAHDQGGCEGAVKIAEYAARAADVLFAQLDIKR